MVFDGLRHVCRQWPGVADAGCTAVADGVETEGVEVLHEASFVVVVGDYAGAGGEGGFDPGRGGESFFYGFLGEEAGGDHDIGIRSVGARGDRRNHNRPVVEIGVGIDAEAGFDRGGGGVSVRAASAAFEVAVGGGVAAFAFPAEHLAGGGLVAVGAEERGELLLEAVGGLREEDAVLRALGAGDGGLYGGEIEREGGGVFGFGGFGGVEEALFAEVGFDEGDVGFGAAGEAEIFEGFVVDGEDAAGGAVLGRHVGDGGAVGEWELGDAGAVELYELADDAVLAEGLR